MLPLKLDIGTLIKDTKANYATYRQQMNQNSNEEFNNYIKSTDHNFSSYQFPDDELTVLSYGLEHHIPNKLNGNRVQVEIEQVYQKLVKDISHISGKLRSTCERYGKIRVPYKYKTITDKALKKPKYFHYETRQRTLWIGQNILKNVYIYFKLNNSLN